MDKIINSYIVIPAFNPDEKLIGYVQELINNGFNKILLVDDGSKHECKEIFHMLAQKPECKLLTHAVNMGKGRALKDAFNYILLNSSGGDCPKTRII